MLLLRLLQFGNLAALSLMVGTLTFLMAICEPIARRRGPAAPAAGQCRRQLDRLWLLAYGASAVAMVMWFAAECTMMSGESVREALSPAVLRAVVQHTEFGQQCTLHFGLIIALAACAVVYKRTGPSAFLLGLALAGSALLLCHMSCFSHAEAMGGIGRAPFLTIYSIHLLSAAVWLGGLPALIAVLWKAYRSREESWAAFSWEAARSFSPLGVASVGALLMSGIINTYLLVGGIPALLGTAYGRVLLIKIALFFAMVGIAAVNKVWLTPALNAGSGSQAAYDFHPILLLLRSVLIESVAGLVVLGMAITLASMPAAIETYGH